MDRGANGKFIALSSLTTEEMFERRMEGQTYDAIAADAGISRQAICERLWRSYGSLVRMKGELRRRHHAERLARRQFQVVLDELERFGVPITRDGLRITIDLGDRP